MNVVFAPPASPALRQVGGPLLGALPRLIRGQSRALLDFRREGGDQFELDLGILRARILCHPELAEELLVHKARNFERGGLFYEPVRGLVGDGLPASEGELWRRQRRLMQPHFHNSAIAKLEQRVAKVVDDTLSIWAREHAHGRPVDVEPLTAHLAMSVALEVVFGSAIEPARAEVIRRALGVAIDGIALGWLSSGLPRWLPSPGRRRFDRAVASLDEQVFAVIDERRASGKIGDDLLGLLLHGAGEDMGPKLLRDEIVSLFLAGYETTGNVLSWALAELAQRPRAFAQLRAEADEHLDPSPGAGLEAGVVKHLSWARRSFEEAMRMYPPAMWIPRMALADDEIGGVEVARGETVIVSIFNIHHHPQVWPQPERFDPARHEPERVRERHRQAFLPFGAGKHLCIGKALAMLEGALALARVGQRFELELDERPQIRLSTTLRSRDGVRLRIRPRALTSCAGR